MKVVILSIADRRHMTPSSVYEDYFRNNNIDYDIICSQRYEQKNTEDNHIYLYKWNSKGNIGKIKKIKEYLAFRKFAINIINKNKYDFIVVWNENTSALFSTYLLINYKNRYCVNIRDTVFDMGIFQYLAWPAIYSAVFCTKPWIRDIEKYPKSTFPLLNKDKKILNKAIVRRDLKKDGKIQILYMGLARIGLPSFKKIISSFANDERFILKFCGVECDSLIRNYVENNKIKNVETQGIFPPDKTVDLLNECDVIMNYYGTGGSQLKVTIGVKASYGPFLNIPQIVDPDTYWAEVCEECGFGYPINDFKNLPNDFYEWYMNLQNKEFLLGCNKYRNFVDETNSKFYSELDKLFLKDNI